MESPFKLFEKFNDGIALKKASAVLKRSYITLVKLSTQLIDPNWDRIIFA